MRARMPSPELEARLTPPPIARRTSRAIAKPSPKPSACGRAPEPRKKRLWDLSEEWEKAREAVAAELTRATAAYLAVLSIQPSHPEARWRLAGLFFERLAAAEDRGDHDAAAL